MDWQYETIDEKLTRLRASLAKSQDELIEAEAELADFIAEVNAFEFEFESKVGHLVDKLSALEAEVDDYLHRIKSLRNEQIFGSSYRTVEDQYRRTWQVPPKSAPTPPPEPLPPATEAEIKKLYRQLARRFHPDLASDEADRAYRTDKMQAINDAYAARSMIELMTIANTPDNILVGSPVPREKTDEEMVKALQGEITRCQRRIQEIKMTIQNIHNQPSVELSLEVKLARRQGRDLLAEMAAELERKIGRKSAERDMIKAQFDSLGPEDGLIRIS